MFVRGTVMKKACFIGAAGMNSTGCSPTSYHWIVVGSSYPSEQEEHSHPNDLQILGWFFFGAIALPGAHGGTHDFIVNLSDRWLKLVSCGKRVVRPR
jgi:hypothetical protein